MTLSSFVLLIFAPTKRHPTYSLGYVWLNIVVYEIYSWKKWPYKIEKYQLNLQSTLGNIYSKYAISHH